MGDMDKCVCGHEPSCFELNDRVRNHPASVERMDSAATLKTRKCGTCGGDPSLVIHPCPDCHAPTPPATAFEAAVDRLSSAIDVCAYYEGRDDLRAAVDEARSALLAAHAAEIAQAVAAERERIVAAWDRDRMLFVGHYHFDHTMQHGVGCYRCKDIRAAMDRLDAAIRGGE